MKRFRKYPVITSRIHLSTIKGIFRTAVTIALCAALSLSTFKLVAYGLLPIENITSLAFPGKIQTDVNFGSNVIAVLSGQRQILGSKSEEDGLDISDDPNEVEDTDTEDSVTPSPQTQPPASQDTDDGQNNDDDDSEYVIKEITVSPRATGSGYESYAGIFVNNQTSFPIDIPELLEQESHFTFNPYNTTVLIVHTHGTESYTEEGETTYDPNDSNHSGTVDDGVIKVGQVLCDTLNAAGIKTIHNTTIHDAEDFSKAYTNTLATIEDELEEWPNVKVVIDVHRDSMQTEDGIKYKPVTTVDGQTAAQVMLIVGTNEGGLKHKDWKQNMSFALKLQYEMISKTKDIARPIQLVPQRYNQHMTGGSLILEVGTAGNTLDEACLSAKLAGEALAKVIKSTQNG